MSYISSTGIHLTGAFFMHVRAVVTSQESHQKAKVATTKNWQSAFGCLQNFKVPGIAGGLYGKTFRLCRYYVKAQVFMGKAVHVL